MNNERRTEWLCGVAVVASAVLYRPITFWADNAWDLSAPLDLFATALLQLVACLLVFSLVVALPIPPFPVALVLGWGVFIVFNWGSLSTGGFLIVGTITAAAYSASVFGGAPPLRVTLVLATMCVVGPVFVLVNAHLTSDTPYPIRSPSIDASATSSGRVEDILVLVVDGYPMVAVAEEWYGHDMSHILTELDSRGFETPRISWSHNTFTSLAIPSMLQLIQVVEPLDVGDWTDQRTNYRVVRGSNFTVQTLQAADFRYHHVESGWNGDTCHRSDSCLQTSWMDEANWQLLKPAVFYPLVEEQMGSHMVTNTLATVHHMVEADFFNDGKQDLVYAHLLLPHPPEVVDSQCHVLESSQRVSGVLGIPDQLACVDSLLEQILAYLPVETAVVITGDHGAATRGQNFRAPSEWSDADIAERLGAFLSYRIPAECPGPEIPSNLNAVAALLACATITDFPADSRGFVIGMDNPTVVPFERISSISSRLAEGSLRLDS